VPSSRAPAASPFARPSPFEADRTRKSGPKAEASSFDAPPAFTESRTTAAAAEPRAASATATAVAVAEEPDPAPATDEVTADSLRASVLSALEEAGQNMLAHNLESGDWSLRGNEIIAKVAMSQVLIDVAIGPEPRRMIQAALNTASGRPLKFKMVGGAVPVASTAARPDASPRPANGAGARSRAMNDPVVQRMRDKFGAEIRTVIDQKGSG
jgi:DNA polymerase-3 subunit gamma/tau